MRNINNIDHKYVWRIPSMAWKEFLHKPSSSCQIDADQHHQCDLICPTYSWEAFKYAKTLGHLYLLQQIEARHLAIVFPTLKELFRRMICT